VRLMRRGFEVLRLSELQLAEPVYVAETLAARLARSGDAAKGE